MLYMGFYAISIYLSVLWLVIYLNNRKIIFSNPTIKNFPSISFLIPAYNEAKTIGRCIKSILNIDYPKDKLKVIVINDGSKDNTAEVAGRFRKFGVSVLNKKNGGKASALNHAMKHVNTDLVACMDADSIATKDYLKKVVGYLKNANVAAVTTSTKILTTRTLMQKIQWVEYMISIIFRKLLAVFDCQFAVPGTGGVYKTSVLRKVGSFDETSKTEDMEIAMRMYSKGYKIENSIDAYVFTDCPSGFKALFKQRMRWYMGYMTNFRKYSFMMFNKKYGNFGIFYMPMTVVWIGLLISLFLFILYNLMFLPLFYFYRIGFMLPQISFSVFSLDSFNLAASISMTFGLVLILLGIRTSNVGNIAGRNKFYLSYIVFYPYLFAFFWLSAVILSFLGVEKKW